VIPVRYEHYLHIKKQSYLRNRPWSPIGVFPVRYEHHLHIYKAKLSPKQAVEARRCVSCEVQTLSTYKRAKLSLKDAVEANTV
jgi:hypothetical protein